MRHCVEVRRFARSASHLIRALDEFDHLGIRFVRVQDHIDTESPMSRAIVMIIGAMAELGSSLTSGRVEAGMKAARALGKHIDSPETPPEGGLPYASVFFILQDRFGYLWLGTGQGLVRYDGYRLRSSSPIQSNRPQQRPDSRAVRRWGRCTAGEHRSRSRLPIQPEDGVADSLPVDPDDLTINQVGQVEPPAV